MPGLAWDQIQVSADREGDAVFGEVSEVVVLHFRMLVRFGNVGRNPVVLVRVEKSPAVVASDCAFSSRFWNWKTDFEPCRKPLGSRQRDEETMEVGAVSKLAVAGPDGISGPITWAGLVVLHVCVDAFVKETPPGRADRRER